MAVSWIVYALLYPALLAIVNVLDKFLLDKRIRDYRSLLPVIGFVALPGGVLITLFSQWNSITSLQLSLGMLSGVLIAISYVIYFHVLSFEEVSRVISIWYAAPVLVSIFAAVILKEYLPWWKYLAIVVAASGAVLIGMKSFARIPVMRKGFWVIISMCVLSGIVSIIAKYLLFDLSIWNVIGLELLGVSLLILFIFSKRSRMHVRQTLKSLHFIVFSEYATYCAWLLWAAAVALTNVSLVSAMGSVQPLYVLILIIMLSTFKPNILKEVFTRKTFVIKAIAILMIVIGTFFVAL
jgi:uncharacterized membrane protein